jgi:hypothetical protein
MSQAFYKRKWDEARAELAAERVLCESYLLDKNQITQAWADELDRVKELQDKLAALSARHERALTQGAQLREALVKAKKALDLVGYPYFTRTTKRALSAIEKVLKKTKGDTE